MGTSYSEFSGSAEAQVVRTLSLANYGKLILTPTASWALTPEQKAFLKQTGAQRHAKFMKSKFAQELEAKYDENFAIRARKPSLAELAEAFAFQLESQLKLQGKRVCWVGPGTLSRSQFHITVDKNEISSMEKLPALVEKLAEKIPTNCLFVQMEIPRGIMGGANGKFGGVCVRVVEEYMIEYDEIMVRFDVLVERVKEDWQGLGRTAAADQFEDFFGGLSWTPEQVEKMKALRPLAIDGEAEKRRLEDQVFKPLSSPKAKTEAKPKDPIPLRALDFANRSARPFTSPDQYKFVPDSWK